MIIATLNGLDRVPRVLTKVARVHRMGPFATAVRLQLPAAAPVTELWRVMTGKAPGRTDGRRVTLFDSVGFALEDFSALHFMRDEAEALGLVEPLDLIPELHDPKDLYALVAPGPCHRSPA